MMAFPGGVGYGSPAGRNITFVRRDLALGYISPETAMSEYKLGGEDIANVLDRTKLGEVF